MTIEEKIKDDLMFSVGYLSNFKIPTETWEKLLDTQSKLMALTFRKYAAEQVERVFELDETIPVDRNDKVDLVHLQRIVHRRADILTELRKNPPYLQP